MVCVEAEVVGSSGLDEPGGEGFGAVVYACSPVLPQVGDDASVLGYDMFSRQQPHAIVAETTVAIGDEVAQFDERVSPIDGVEHIAAELFEPCLIEVMCSFLGLVAIGIGQFERLGHDEALALCDTAGEVCIDGRVAVDVVEVAAVWRVDVDGPLPGLPPGGNVLACECIGSLLKGDNHTAEATAVVIASQVELAVWGAEHVLWCGRWGEEPLQVVCYLCHGVYVFTSCDGGEVVSDR